jgi:hypothetical protein
MQRLMLEKRSLLLLLLLLLVVVVKGAVSDRLSVLWHG